MEAILATAPVAEWVARLEAATVAAGPVYEFHEVFDDPQVRHLGLVAEMEQPGAGRVRILGFPGRASATPPRITVPRHFSASTRRRCSASSASRARRSTGSPRPASSSWAKTREPAK